MKHLKEKVVLWAAGMALLLNLLPLHAQAATDRVVRVAFPIQGDISYIDENGDYVGYLGDYLKQLALFTDWEIEYVSAEGDINTQLSTLLDQLQSGEIDMMGTMKRNAALEELFLYPNYSYGSTYTVLAVREDSAYINENFSNWDGITVASYPGLEARMELFEQYAKVNGFTYEVRNYDIVTDWADTKELSYAVAVINTLPNADMMVSLLNQFASSISSQNTQARLSGYLLDEIKYTPAEWILANRDTIAIVSLIFGFFIIVLIFFGYHKKMAYNTLANENKLLQLSSYDELTGAYNRSYFCKLVDQKIKNHEPWALIALNIHNFKYINDTYGTYRADQLLCKVKDILESDLNDGELLCRPIADSFYLAISEYRSEDIIQRINRLEPRLKEMADDLLDGYRLLIYFGAISSATSPDLSSIQANLNCIMVALAHAKQSGDSNICIYDDFVHQQEQLRQYVEVNKYRALDEGEYQVYLQPKMNLRTGKIESAEALVRWQTKDRGLLFPDQFIPLFEQSGFCKHLDLYMLEKSCELLRNWMNEGIPPVSISINQTKSLFVSDDYLDKLLEITSRYQVSPQYIVLEILEGLAFENISELNNIISALHEAGFRVSMDDFGSGYSSLNTLGKLHIDQIKLDRMFLMDLRDDQRSSQNDVMHLIFALAKKLGIETVTEGVETQADEGLIQSMGCNYGQGYYYSKPIPAKEFRNVFLKG